MNHREIAVAISNDNQEVSVTETIDAIKNAGFKNVFIQWYNKDWNPSQEEQLKYVRKQGLNVIFAHLGYQNINDLWLENENGENLVPRYINDLKICKENNIPYYIIGNGSNLLVKDGGVEGVVIKFCKLNKITVNGRE